MKKLISLCLVLAFLLSFPIAARAEGEVSPGFENFKAAYPYTDGRFTDVQPTDWFSASVKSVYELGLMNGKGETTFAPNGITTIAEAITLACRLHSIYHTGSDSFPSGSPWYQPYMDYAIQNGIIEEGSIANYTVPASRSFFAYVIYKALPPDTWTKLNNVTTIPDVPADQWYQPFVLVLYNAGILSGSDEYGTFNPTSNIKRSEVAAIMDRVAVPADRKVFVLETPPAPTGKDYIYLAQYDFRQIKNKYSSATGLKAYVTYFINKDGHQCVVVDLWYKIISTYNETYLHDLDSGRIIQDPVSYYNKLMRNAWGSSFTYYSDLQLEILDVLINQEKDGTILSADQLNSGTWRINAIGT